MESILTSVKKALGIMDGYNHFDADLVMHINSVFAILTQLGVGPPNGFMIYDENSLWSDYLPYESPIEFVKSFMYMKVRLLFDPPTSSAAIESMNRLLSELEWRIQVAVDPVETSKGEEEIQNGY